MPVRDPGGAPDAPIICLSHLRWDFVWQRPQQLMSRLARTRRVYFVEEPVFADDAGVPPDGARWRWNRTPRGVPPASGPVGVVVATPTCQDPGPGGGGSLDRMYARLVADLVASEGLDRAIAWFYTPMLLPAIDRLGDIPVVYDAMDELTLFRHAPADLATRETALLARAAITFAGGRSLGEAKALRHSRVRTFPSGVEADHYRPALDLDLPVPPDLDALPTPRVGYVGVIDERIDYDLLRDVAERRPDVSWVMIGPVVKVDPAELPVAPNIAYLGQKAYADLPAYVRGLAICMMPFALNDATRFISPTKTLEYMAAHRPIVSTPVTDVVREHGDLVRVANDGESFAAAIAAALAEGPEDREARITRELVVLARNSWDAIAQAMDEELRAALGEQSEAWRDTAIPVGERA